MLQARFDLVTYALLLYGNSSDQLLLHIAPMFVLYKFTTVRDSFEQHIRLMFPSSPQYIILHYTANQTRLLVTDLSDRARRQICDRLKCVRMTPNEERERERRLGSSSPLQLTPTALQTT